MSDNNVPAAGDALYGVAAIAKHLQWTERQVLHRHEKGELPTFKIGRTVCATRSGLAAHFAAQQAAARGETAHA